MGTGHDSCGHCFTSGVITGLLVALLIQALNWNGCIKRKSDYMPAPCAPVGDSILPCAPVGDSVLPCAPVGDSGLQVEDLGTLSYMAHYGLYVGT